MIVPAIGYVPAWMIVMSVSIAGALLAVARLRFQSWFLGWERSFSAFNTEVGIWFSTLSDYFRQAQVDTLNRDVLLVSSGLILLFLLYILFGGAVG